MQLDLTKALLKLRQNDGRTFVFDPIRKKWLVLTPEEFVRQSVIAYLVETLQYPKGKIAVEKTIMVGAMPKRFDVIVYAPDHTPWMLVECKAPEVMVSEAALHQLLNYQRTVQCRYWLLTNGHQSFCADAANVNDIQWKEMLPLYGI